VLAGDQRIAGRFPERVMERAMDANIPLAGHVALANFADVNGRNGAAVTRYLRARTVYAVIRPI
jgi:hypothetical protein